MWRSAKGVGCCIAAAALLAGPVACSKDPEKLSEDALVDGLVAAKWEDRPEYVDAIAKRGEPLLDEVMAAFEKATGDTELRRSLVKSVFGMSPTDRTIEALKKMRDTASDPEERMEIDGFYAQRAMGQRS